MPGDTLVLGSPPGRRGRGGRRAALGSWHQVQREPQGAQQVRADATSGAEGPSPPGLMESICDVDVYLYLYMYI